MHKSIFYDHDGANDLFVDIIDESLYCKWRLLMNIDFLTACECCLSETRVRWRLISCRTWSRTSANRLCRTTSSCCTCNSRSASDVGAAAESDTTAATPVSARHASPSRALPSPRCQSVWGCVWAQIISNLLPFTKKNENVGKIVS